VHLEIPDKYYWSAEMYPEPEVDYEDWEQYVDDIQEQD
jgi:hypothetical protein